MSYNIFSRVLDRVGDGTGEKNAISNYAASAGTFRLTPPAGTVFSLHRMLIYVEDTGAFDAEKYGNALDLTAGIVVRVADANGVIVNLTDDVPIMNNGDWSRLCFDVNVMTYGTGNEYLTGRWTFAKSGVPITLDGNKGEYFEVYLQDSVFTGLVEHRFTCQGYQYR